MLSSRQCHYLPQISSSGFLIAYFVSDRLNQLNKIGRTYHSSMFFPSSASPRLVILAEVAKLVCKGKDIRSKCSYFNQILMTYSILNGCF